MSKKKPDQTEEKNDPNGAAGKMNDALLEQSNKIREIIAEAEKTRRSGAVTRPPSRSVNSAMPPIRQRSHGEAREVPGLEPDDCQRLRDARRDLARRREVRRTGREAEQERHPVDLVAFHRADARRGRGPPSGPHGQSVEGGLDGRRLGGGTQAPRPGRATTRARPPPTDSGGRHRPSPSPQIR